jgi:hypothetical protein
VDRSPGKRTKAWQGTLSPGARVVQAPGILAAPSESELLLVREETSDCYALRGSGIEIWEAARQPVRLDQICDALQQVYEVDRGTCERNVMHQVEELLRQGLLARAD